MNRRAIALVMVMGIVTMLSFFMLSFTQESAVRRLQLTNFYAKEQAKSNAYSASNIAMLLLDLYAQAVSVISKNNNFPISERDLEDFLVRTPLMFPVMELPGLGQIQKNLIQDFNKTLLMNGSFMLEFRTVTGGLNPNNLILIDMIQVDETTVVNRMNDTARFFEETISRKISEKSETDAEFANKYRNIDARELVEELIFVVNSADNIQALNLFKLSNLYASNGITPKHAPFTSVSELNTLLLWDDELLDLIKNEIVLRPNIHININRMGKDDLKLIFPGLDDISIDIFLRYRDGDAANNIEAHPFVSVNDFRNYAINNGYVMNEKDYTSKMNILKASGITLSNFSKYFNVKITGNYQDYSYQLTLFTELYQEEMDLPKIEGGNQQGSGSGNESENPNDEDVNRNNSNQNNSQMVPTITEIIID